MRMDSNSLSKEQSELAVVFQPDLSINTKSETNDKNRPPSPASSKSVPISDLKSRCIGCFCVLICVISWIAIAELEPVLFAGTSFSDKPFFLQYTANSMLMLCIIPWAILKVVDRTPFARNQILDESLIMLNTENVPSYQSVRGKNMDSPSSSKALIMVPSAIIVSGLNSLQNYLWFVSLYYTIAAVNNTIYQLQCVFVLIFSMSILGHKPTVFNILSVIVSAFGVAMISCFGTESEDNPSVEPNTFGIVMVLCSAVIVALMQVMMHRVEQTHFDQEDSLQKLKDMLFFQFLIGTAVVTLWWPGFVVLDLLGIEPFMFPVGDEQWIKLFAFSALCFSFVIGWLIGITYRGALFMSLGILLVVPVSFVVDVWFYGLEISAVTIAGTVCVVVGFLLMQKGSLE